MKGTVAYILAILLVFSTSTLANPRLKPEHAPMSLDWDKKYTFMNPPTGYRYYMGDISWGLLVFSGVSDFLGSETELQVFFNEGKISQLVLILGPEGLSEISCFSVYKRLVKYLNKKYGHFKYKSVERDPVLDELLYASDCYPLRIGLVSSKNLWHYHNYIIKSKIFGDDGDIFIEVEYTLINRLNNQKKNKTKEIIKRL